MGGVYERVPPMLQDRRGYRQMTDERREGGMLWKGKVRKGMGAA